MPEAEFRQTWGSTSDGRPMKPRNSPGFSVFMNIMTAKKKYTEIPIPALVIFAIPHKRETWMTKNSDSASRKDTVTYFNTLGRLAEKQVKAIKSSIPTAHVVKLYGMHYIFLSNEKEVLRQIAAL